ncbi:hypothetical protein Droror1_Dr00013157 [Drosera rotundifolia]
MAAAKRVDFDLDRNDVVDSMGSVDGSGSVSERAFSVVIVLSQSWSGLCGLKKSTSSSTTVTIAGSIAQIESINFLLGDSIVWCVIMCSVI